MTTTNFVWDCVNDCYLAEIDVSNNMVAVYTNEPVHFGKIISQDRNGTVSYFHFDAQASARQLTNQNQTVSDEYVFSAFGETIASTGGTVNPFRYVGAYGYYADSEIIKIYVRARTYKPSLGCWSSKDPIGFEGSKWNLYWYVESNPINSIDPSGEKLKGAVSCVRAYCTFWHVCTGLGCPELSGIYMIINMPGIFINMFTCEEFEEITDPIRNPPPIYA